MKKAHFSLLLLYCCAGSYSLAQTPIPAPILPAPIIAPQPLALMTQYLSLTNSQVQTIVQNNNAFNQFSSGKQARIFQVQTEIAQVTQASPIDPMALGLRYGEIEEICRELRTNAAQSQQQNRAVLADPQKAKLQALQDAMNLFPVIAEGQNGNLLPNTGTPTFFNNFSSFLLGGIISAGPGCVTPSTPTIVVRAGDFVPNPIPAPTAKPAN